MSAAKDYRRDNMGDPENTHTPRYSEIWESMQKATQTYGLCPNRVWAVVRSHQLREKCLPQLMDCRPDEPIKGHENHDQCGFDFCEHSRRDFTAVAQRHELEACVAYPCQRLRFHFPIDVLEKTAEAEKLTAWKLDGKSMVESPQPFMAISHVWSDGTGTGAWQQGEVNQCLYNYFKAIAERFQCEGIWWDTLCIPKGKVARNKAINRMHINYEDARVTLVHDCFLREWEWFDAETACFAIIMSPWFSRGWTALELAKSRKVKVVFKGSIIKDLDEDILVKAATGPIRGRHQIASDLIANLRRGTITTINGLLQVLHSRYTSWPRDIATISGLLAGVEMGPDASQQGIYQDILKKMHRPGISHGHLFHNSTTMSEGFSWCPTSLHDLQISRTENPLELHKSGDVTGKWLIISSLSWIRRESYNWKDVHPLIEARLRSALEDLDKHMLLAEPGATDEPLTRALLVVPVERGSLDKCQFVGSVYFQPPLHRQILEKHSVGPIDVTIGNARESSKKLDEDSHASLSHYGDGRHDPNSIDENTWTPLHYAIWRSDDRRAETLIKSSDYTVQDRLGQCAIHLASERGSQNIVCLLLNEGADPNIQDSKGQTALHRAIWGGCIEVIRLLLGREADPHIQDSNGQTALHLAILYGNREATGLLIKLVKSGNNINTSDCRGRSPLHVAAMAGDKEVARLLLDAQADIDLLDSDGWRPIHSAAESGNIAIVELLREREASSGVSRSDAWKLLHSAAKGGLECEIENLLCANEADVHSRDSEGHSALHRAAEGGGWAAVKVLLEKGADIESVDFIGRTPLSRAARNGHESVVQLLLKEGADIESRDGNEKTALWQAAKYGHGAVVRLLLDQGADKESMDERGQRPLWQAAKNGHEAIIDLLLKKGADIEAQDIAGKNPRSMAARMNRMVVAELLPKTNFLETGPGWAIQNGFEDTINRLFEGLYRILDLGDLSGETPPSPVSEDTREAAIELMYELLLDEDVYKLVLGWASEGGNQDIATVMLENNAEMESERGFGQTVLSWAARKGYKNAVDLLLEKGADKESKDSSGQTPLLWAAMNGHEDVSNLLIKNGANAEARNKSKQSPLFWAAKNGYHAIAKLLIEEGADVDLRDGYRNAPLVEAAREGHTAIVELLLEHGAVTESEYAPQSPLVLAIQKRHEAVVKLLLENGAETESRGRNGRTPLIWAVKNRDEGITELLLENGANIESKDFNGNTPLSIAAKSEDKAITELLLKKGGQQRAG